MTNSDQHADPQTLQETPRRPARAGRPRKPASAADRRQEQRLDEGLDETFPASDPVSVYHGVD